jgi:hypothetical protein
MSVSKDANVDTNIDNYTSTDLKMLLNLRDDYTAYQAKDATNTLIAKMKSDKNKPLQVFFQQVQDKLLAYLKNPDDDENKDDQETEADLQALQRFAKVADDANADVDREMLDLARLDLKGGTKYFSKNRRKADLIIEPSWQNASMSADGTRFFQDQARTVLIDDNQQIHNITKPKIISTRIVVIDSQYRTNLLPFTNNPLIASYTTSFSFNLANPINNAIGFKLYSYQIPTTWYALNSNVGNTFFQFNGVIIKVPDGNYTITQLVDKINLIAQQDIASQFLNVSYPDPNTGIITFTNNDTFADNVTVYFYVQANTSNVYKCSFELLQLFQTVGINNTLGWILGFRTAPDLVTGDVYLIMNKSTSIPADVLPDVYGPKYFTLSVEDFNNQRLTSGLTNITHTKQAASLTVPDYFNTINVACKLREGNLTQAQLYSINSVVNDNLATNTVNVTNQALGPNLGDTFALIPLRDIPSIRPMPYVQFGTDLFVNERKYLQPFRMERILVRLLDDKGNLVDLHDNDWSFSLVVEALIG